jgi:hypothetical protein
MSSAGVGGGWGTTAERIVGHYIFVVLTELFWFYNNAVTVFAKHVNYDYNFSKGEFF